MKPVEVELVCQEKNLFFPLLPVIWTDETKVEIFGHNAQQHVKQ